MDTDNMFDTQLNDEERETFIKDGTDFIDNLKEETKNIQNIVDYNENPHNLPVKNMKVIVDPDTGENKILGSSEEAIDESELKNSFDEMVRKINEDDDTSLIDDRPITEQEAVDYLSNNINDSIFGELAKDTNLSTEAIRKLLEVTNRRIKGEKFNAYKEFPEEIKKIIDDYVIQNGAALSGVNIAQINSIKHNVADTLLDEFISDIQIDRSKNDFARDLEHIYQTSAKEISDASLEYIDERNKAYREAAEEIEDESKKARLLAILDRIDEARSLSELKEFAKTCKIKPIELEKPERRVYDSFLAKYKNSNNNIYDIKIAKDVLYRHLEKDAYSMKDIDAFFIAFCKQVSKYSVDIAVDHAYMYYVLYYCALLDGDKSLTFINNVKDVISNLRERNNIINK